MTAAQRTAADPAPPATALVTPQQTPASKTKSSGSKLTWILVAVAALVIYSLVNGMGADDSSPTASQPGPGGTTSGGTTSGAKTARLGQAVTVEGVEITVLDAKYSRGFEFQEPASGHIYVAFNIRAKAVSGSSFVSSGDWTALADGTRQGQWTIVIDDQWSPTFPFDELREGATTEGWVIFEVPDPSKFVRLVYDPSIFSSEAKLTVDFNCCD